MNAIERAIPKHQKGTQKHFTTIRKFISADHAQLCYDHAISRLLNINHWNTISPAGEDTFRIMSAQLKQQRRKARLGDYVRIAMPAPANADGEGYDWVQVVTLKFSSGKRKEQCLLTLQPCAMPGHTNTAHFFSHAATSTFLLTRNGQTVSAEYYGHNEQPNTDTSGIKTTVRNVAVAAGAMLGISDTLWKPLIEGLLMDGTKLREQKKGE